uniref:Alpha-1,3/1,6-mannosyltransferase ALG2 n=1 Tax=Entamoeba invadens TaxID=33085 RepID=S0B8J3_ENTIV|nr:alpha-1,3-mannosyltransferase ALG2, putative [Entamoeba invadens]
MDTLVTKTDIIIHPDLGIGGAERLVVDLALALEHEDYDVKFYTSHHDKKHCFPETNGRFQVFVHGDFIPMTIFGYFYIFLATIRALYLAFVAAWKSNADLYIVDQISVGVPILKLFNKKVLFYCHHPDKLLVKKGGFMKRMYRKPFDWIEEKAMSFADTIVVNSLYTQTVYEKAFPSHSSTPQVLYPTYNPILEEENQDEKSPFEEEVTEEFMFVSINRYEGKKNHDVAISALNELPEDLRGNVRVVIAGGFDDRVIENIEVYKYLESLAKKLGVEHHVTLIKNFTNPEREYLLKRATAVLYTPPYEHFGIVPLEAMIKNVPVIACNNGGPLETVQDGITGMLCDGSPKGFAQCITKMCNDKELRENLKQNAKNETKKKFGFETFTRNVINVVNNILAH